MFNFIIKMAVDLFKFLEIMPNYPSLLDVKSNMYKDKLKIAPS